MGMDIRGTADSPGMSMSNMGSHWRGWWRCCTPAVTANCSLHRRWWPLRWIHSLHARTVRTPRFTTIVSHTLRGRPQTNAPIHRQRHSCAAGAQLWVGGPRRVAQPQPVTGSNPATATRHLGITKTWHQLRISVPQQRPTGNRKKRTKSAQKRNTRHLLPIALATICRASILNNRFKISLRTIQHVLK
jgi:hypothetical protein